jgi:nitrous oxidase accessory protein
MSAKSIFLGVFLILLTLFSVNHLLGLGTVNAISVKSLTVPNDYSTIQQAINNANNGDTIIVKRGIYYGALEINKSVSLIGEDACATVINGQSETQYLFPSGTSTVSIYAPNVWLSGFNITDCDVAIYIGSSGAHVTGTDIDHNMAGFSGGGSNIIISENNITDNLRGINLSCLDSVISNNLFCNNLYALSVSSSENVSVCYNRIINNSCGLSLGSVSNTCVFNNSFVKNLDVSNYLGTTHISSDGCGIYLDSNCNKTLIRYNNIWGNSRGVSLNDIHLIHGSQGSDNLLFDNNLFDNKQNAYLTDFGELSHVFSWDNGTVGNYWGDYREKYPNATQEDTLCIWNTPYNINNDNTDQYPLVLPINITIESPSANDISDSSPIPLTIGIVVISAIILFITLAVIRRSKKNA